MDRMDAETLGAADVPDASGFGLELEGADDVAPGDTLPDDEGVPFALGLALDEQPASARMMNRIARRFMLLERTRRAGTRQTARHWVCGVACRQAVSPHDA